MILKFALIRTGYNHIYCLSRCLAQRLGRIPYLLRLIRHGYPYLLC